MSVTSPRRSGRSPRLLALLALFMPGIAACDSAEKQGQSCPEGSGSVFVEDGPDGPGCYCPAGTVANATATQCLPGSSCAPFGRAEGGVCVDIDECQEGTAGCDANAICTNKPNAAPTCACKPDFSGDGTTCTFSGDCGAFARPVDDACIDIDECQEDTAGCAATATCRNNDKAPPTCTCPANNAGDGKTCIPCEAGQKPSGNACVDVDECADGLDNCAETGSVCTNLSPGFSCRCKAPFVGDGTTCACPSGQEPSGAASCVDIDECARDLDDCDPNATCRNTFPGFTCKCKLGFDGDGQHCLPVVCPPGYEFKTSGTFAGTCQDIDECFTDTDGCDANQICINLRGSFRCDCMSSSFVKDADGHCVCKPGYAPNGANSCSDINECTNNVAGCSANATCTNLDGGALCRCKPGFQGDGKTCDPTPCAAGYQTAPSGTGCVDANECALGVAGCSANADCFNTVGSFTCRCKEGYTGNGQ
ncbi:MAG: hypothetical protein JNJ59_22345, partial [Deltaproteobacteria bacterium]|nr:hypothetical protein [Deltaproteobacteria bacterium]